RALLLSLDLGGATARAALGRHARRRVFAVVCACLCDRHRFEAPLCSALAASGAARVARLHRRPWGLRSLGPSALARLCHWIDVGPGSIDTRVTISLLMAGCRIV